MFEIDIAPSIGRITVGEKNTDATGVIHHRVRQIILRLMSVLSIQRVEDFVGALGDESTRGLIEEEIRQHFMPEHEGGTSLRNVAPLVRGIIKEDRFNRVFGWIYADADFGDPLPIHLVHFPTTEHPFLIALSYNTRGVAEHEHANGHIELRFWCHGGRLKEMTVVVTQPGTTHTHEPLEADGRELYVLNISPEPELAESIGRRFMIDVIGELFKRPML